MLSLGKQYGSCSKKLKIKLPYDPTIPLLSIYPKEKKRKEKKGRKGEEKTNLKWYIHSSVYSSILYNSQDMEATQVSIDWWMDKQNVVYTYKGVLYSLKKEGNFDISQNMDELWGQILWFHLYEELKFKKCHWDRK